MSPLNRLAQSITFVLAFILAGARIARADWKPISQYLELNAVYPFCPNPVGVNLQTMAYVKLRTNNTAIRQEMRNIDPFASDFQAIQWSSQRYIFIPQSEETPDANTWVEDEGHSDAQFQYTDPTVDPKAYKLDGWAAIVSASFTRTFNDGADWDVVVSAYVAFKTSEYNYYFGSASLDNYVTVLPTSYKVVFLFASGPAPGNHPIDTADDIQQYSFLQIKDSFDVPFDPQLGPDYADSVKEELANWWKIDKRPQPSNATWRQGHELEGSWWVDDNHGHRYSGPPWTDGTFVMSVFQRFSMVRHSDGQTIIMNTHFVTGYRQYPPFNRTESFWPVSQ